RQSPFLADFQHFRKRLLSGEAEVVCSRRSRRGEQEWHGCLRNGQQRCGILCRAAPYFPAHSAVAGTELSFICNRKSFLNHCSLHHSSFPQLKISLITIWCDACP